MAAEDPEKTKEVRKYLQQSHDRIFENNKKWADEMRKKKPEFFTDLTAGQAPEYLWIGMSTLRACPLHHSVPEYTTQHWTWDES
jgi:carbonic anhydrase